MDTKLTGLINEGDTRDLKDWIEKVMGASAERKSEILDLKVEICHIREAIEAMQKKVDNIEHILEEVSD